MQKIEKGSRTLERLFNKALREITYDDILGFLSTQPSEGIRLDYKREIAATDNAKKELAKDVSAFANSQGGHLLIGVDEKDLSPILPPCGTARVINNVKVSEWIAQVLNATIAQRVDFDVNAVPMPDEPDKCIVIVRVPQSPRAPHMVIFQGDNHYYRRYFKRHQFQAMPAEEYEVREMFERSLRFQSNTDAYLEREGYGDFRSPEFGRNLWTTRLLGQDQESVAKTWVSIVACPTYLEEQIDVTAASFKSWIDSPDRRYEPLPGGGARTIPRRRKITLDGVAYVRDHFGKGWWNQHIRFHRNGFIEFANSDLSWTNSGDQEIIYGWVNIVGYFWLSLGLIKDLYSYLDLSTSFRLFLNVINAEKTVLAGLSNDYVVRGDHTRFLNQHRSLEPNISYGEELRLSSLSTSEETQAVVRRYATRLGNAFGYDEPLCYNKADGQFPINQIDTNAVLPF